MPKSERKRAREEARARAEQWYEGLQAAKQKPQADSPAEQEERPGRTIRPSSPEQAEQELSENEAEQEEIQEEAQAQTEQEALLEVKEESLDLVEPEEQEKDETPFWKSWLMGLALLTAGLCLVVVFGFDAEWSTTLTPTTTTTTTTTIHKPKTTALVSCYLDSPSENADDDKMTVIPACQDVPNSEWLPCLKNAHCLGGAIERCVDTKHCMLKDNTCVLNDQARETIQAMVRKLGEWHAADICRSGGNASVPLFGYSQLVDELGLEQDVKLIHAASNDEKSLVVVRAPDGDVLIGLHPSHKVTLPGTCRAKLFLLGRFETMGPVLQAALGLVWAIVVWSLDVYLQLFFEIPLFTTFFTIILPVFWIIVTRLRRRRLRKALDRQEQLYHVRIQRRVYELLSAEDFRPIRSIRDEIRRDPNLAMNEERMFKDIWPEVVVDINRDKRVLKRRINMDGVSRECWKWSDGAGNATSSG